MELQVGEIIQLQESNFTGNKPAERFLIVKDVEQFNLSNKSKFLCWDTKAHSMARVTVSTDNNFWNESLYLIKPEFEEVKYLALSINISYIASIRVSENEPKIWHEIVLRKATDE